MERGGGDLRVGSGALQGRFLSALISISSATTNAYVEYKCYKEIFRAAPQNRPPHVPTTDHGQRTTDQSKGLMIRNAPECPRMSPLKKSISAPLFRVSSCGFVDQTIPPILVHQSRRAGIRGSNTLRKPTSSIAHSPIGGPAAPSTTLYGDARMHISRTQANLIPA